LATAIRDGGEIFPVGVREQARQVAANLPPIIDTLQALTERSAGGLGRTLSKPMLRRD
jgi:hypothetical protein